MFKTLMPQLFNLNKDIFEHLLSTSASSIKFQAYYAYFNIPVLYLHVIFAIFIAHRIFREKMKFDSVFLEIEN